MTDSTPGWRPDPTGRHEHRYWDGSKWTDQISDGGLATTDAYAGDAAETPATEATTAPPGSGGWDDPTTVQPNPGGDVTTSWNAVPPPPGAPTPPTPTGGPVEPDRDSKRKLLIGSGILAAVVLAVILFVALGSDDDDAELTGPASQTEDTADEAAEPGGEEPSGEAGEPGLDDLEGVEFNDEMIEMLANTYEENLGLERGKAECLASTLAEAIESGALTEMDAATDFMDYLDECDISLRELGAAAG